jgi:hypothetical protein
MSEVEARFEALSRALATGHSRRGVLKLGAALVGAGIASALTGRASARPLRAESSFEGNSDCEAFCKVVCEGTAGTGEEASNCHGMCTSAAAMAQNEEVDTSLCGRCVRDVANICGDFDPTDPEGALCCVPPETCCASVTERDVCCNPGQLCCAGGGHCVGPCGGGQIPSVAQCRCCTPSGSSCGSNQQCCSGFCRSDFFFGSTCA